ncbi:pyridoxal phosphate-dependent transferase [Dactylonectria macrodidyma]|uniref:Pyridoxal phosphate-dependent transferase n=1 Tax=Dactylonectria macrodidyma TaxID=307937 RepID=A0A9P9FH92_9HYPO|nr:pyridoxal phosphate-dependent transferase [Dactylonectria macrodidyma]
MSQHINLQLGWPSPSLFPSSQLLSAAPEVLQSPKKTSASLIYGPDAGYQPLRQAIAGWLTSIYSPKGCISPDRICVSNGASANLGNILAKFAEPGYTKRVWMIEPSYFLACPIFTDAGFEGRLRGVPEDEEGLDVEFLRESLRCVDAEEKQEAPKLKTGPRYSHLYKHIIYAVPTFANPSGKTMSYRRRCELVRLAREFDALVITDDVYDVLRWSEDENGDVSKLEAVPPRIVDLDGTLDGGPQHEWGNAVSNGSFSKIIAPGIRTGWAEATPAFTLALSQLGATRSGGCPSQLAASFVYEMIATGALEKHIASKLIPTYSSRYYAMFRAIKEHLLPLGFCVSTGKPYSAALISNAPADLSITVAELAALALEKYDLKFAYGGMMTVEGDESSVERASSGFGNGIRLCWAWHTEDEILEGIQRLASLTKEVKAKRSV